jgi:hypothetical protein
MNEVDVVAVDHVHLRYCRVRNVDYKQMSMQTEQHVNIAECRLAPSWSTLTDCTDADSAVTADNNAYFEDDGETMWFQR